MNESPLPGVVADRRGASRHLPAFGTVCRIGPETPEEAEALVWNLSARGISMLLPSAPTEGDVLAAELVSEAVGACVPVLFRVLRVRPSRGGDHLVAAAFLRSLSPDELEPFITPVGANLFPAEIEV